MLPKLGFTRVGQTHLFQSETFLVVKEEIEHIFEFEEVNGGDLRAMIEGHEMIVLQTQIDLPVKCCFWPVPGTNDQWVIDIVAPEGARVALPNRLIEVLMNKEPMPKHKPSSDPPAAIPQSEPQKTRATVWITYAWADNTNQDVDFIAQELIKFGLEVKLDRWNIGAGSRLWEQIDRFIQSENESDAWILYATSNSLGSEACKEEFAYALDRALGRRGQDYPIIGLFPGPIDGNLIPAGIRTRLYVSTTDPDWKERIRSAAEGRSPSIPRVEVKPYDVRKHAVEGGFLLEFRPRAGTWYPFLVGVPVGEKEKVGQNPFIVPGAPGSPPHPGGGFILAFNGVGEVTGSDGLRWWTISPMGEATPAKSFYLFVTSLPSRVIFGPQKGPQFMITQFD